MPQIFWSSGWGGGPTAVTAKLREMGDTVTRLCYEPDLGLVLSADLRDTTSPFAMAQLVRRITTGDLLKGSSQEHLLLWMQNTGTGPNRLRAGLPVGVAYREQDWNRTNGRNYQQVQ